LGFCSVFERFLGKRKFLIKKINNEIYLYIFFFLLQTEHKISIFYLQKYINLLSLDKILNGYPEGVKFAFLEALEKWKSKSVC
jgi:hypothetical protein